jgi:hypothetical protein
VDLFGGFGSGGLAEGLFLLTGYWFLRDGWDMMIREGGTW